MAKQANKTTAASPVAGHAAAKAARKPSKGTVTQVAAAPQAAPQAAPVALRGGLVLTSLKLSGKVYRVAAPHNVAWWQTTQDVIAKGKGVASTQAIVAAGVPASMVGYLYRRGYLAAA